MTYVLGIDVETTGLDPDEDEIIELGMVLWDWEYKKPIKIFNELVDGEKNIPEDIQKLTGITGAMRGIFGWSTESIKSVLHSFMSFNPILMAYNAKFDSGFINKLISLPHPHWLCAMEDVDYPDHFQSKKLSYLAADHGFINPFAHRAIFDVLTMFKVLENYDLNKIVENSKEEKVNLIAQVSYSERNKAKALGYKWIDGSWKKTVRNSQIEVEREKAKELNVFVTQVKILERQV